MAINVKADIRDLKRCVGELHRDLLAFQTRTLGHFERILGRFDKIGGHLNKVDGRLDRVEKEVRELRKDLPGIVGDAVREANRERSRKR
jgi:hypothetical protein